jgi:MFS family permease
MTPTVEPASYRRVLATPGFRTLWGGALLARIGQQMTVVVLVLFVLARFGSASLAGAAVFFAVAPGLLVSPIAGALLDRRRRIRLITLDYAVAAVCMAAVGVLDRAGVLTSVLLLVIVGASSFTNPLSNTGTRSLYPMVLPRDLWDRANALDSGGFVVAMVIGPAIAGATVALFGGAAGLLATAAIFALATLVVSRVPEPAVVQGGTRGLLGDAADGFRYVVRSPSLRGLAICLSIANVGNGIFVVALPLVVLERFSGGPGEVGALWAVSGAAGMVGAFLAGRLDSTGRERHLIALGVLVGALGLLLVEAAPAIGMVAAGLVVYGASSGPVDVGLFSLRQRRTDPAWLGRAFAVSMSLNFSGIPIGSAIGGPLSGRSLTAALILAVVLNLVAAAVPELLIPDRQGEEELRLAVRLTV